MVARAPMPYRDASVVTARPITPGPIFTPGPPYALTAGSDINDAAIYGPSVTPPGAFTSGSQWNKARIGAPWPKIIDAGTRIQTDFHPNAFREVAHHNIAGNYGSVSSIANFGYRAQEYPVTDDINGANGPGIGGYPGSVPYPKRPMWNNLLAIIYALRVVNPVAGGSYDSQVQPSFVVGNQNNPVEFVPSGTASLSIKGESLA